MNPYPDSWRGLPSYLKFLPAIIVRPVFCRGWRRADRRRKERALLKAARAA